MTGYSLAPNAADTQHGIGSGLARVDETNTSVFVVFATEVVHPAIARSFGGSGVVKMGEAEEEPHDGTLRTPAILMVVQRLLEVLLLGDVAAALTQEDRRERSSQGVLSPEWLLDDQKGAGGRPRIFSATSKNATTFGMCFSPAMNQKFSNSLVWTLANRSRQPYHSSLPVSVPLASTPTL
jgi:hypothetical protein